MAIFDDWLQAEREVIERRLASPQYRSLLPVLLDDWQLARATGSSLLLMGPDEATRTLVEALRHQLPGPVLKVRGDAPLPLAPMQQAATVILQDISRLTTDDQQRLLIWQDTALDGTQLISTTPRPLLPLVLEGSFMATLYYRLNTICLDVTATAREVESSVGEDVGQGVSAATPRGTRT